MSIGPTASSTEPGRSATRRLLGVLGLGVAALLGPAWLAFGADTSATFRSDLLIDGNRLAAATIELDLGLSAASVRVLNLAPGDARPWLVEIRNSGTVALRYALLTASSDPVLGWGLIVTVHADSGCAGAALAPGVPLGSTRSSPLLGDPEPGAQRGDRQLGPGETETLCVLVRVPPAAGNELQGLQTRHTVTAVAETT